jgi:hypothetical protein
MKMFHCNLLECIPPKVDINGKGFIKAPLTGSAAPGGLAVLLG